VAARSDVIRERVGTFRQAKITLNAVDIREKRNNIAALLESPARRSRAGGQRPRVESLSRSGELYLNRFIRLP
jgi:hypothetical protein